MVGYSLPQYHYDKSLYVISAFLLCNKMKRKIYSIFIVLCCEYFFSLRNHILYLLQVLFPCDIELSRIQLSTKVSPEITIKLTDIYVHMSSTTIRIILDVTNVLTNGTQVSI